MPMMERLIARQEQRQREYGRPCDHCSHLQAENAALREELGQQTTVAAVALATRDRFQQELRAVMGDATEDYLLVLRRIVANERAALARERRRSA